jgi:outer membrane protein
VFLRAGRESAPDNHEARARFAQMSAQRSASVARLLPSFSAEASYFRNQYAAEARLPNAAGGFDTGTFTAEDQLDARLTVTIPLLDVASWQRLAAARAAERASAHSAESMQLDVDSRVGSAYFQLVAAEALLRSAARTLTTSERTLATVEGKVASGLASLADLERARAEIAKNLQSVADAKFARAQARRSLRSLTRLEPSGVVPDLPVDTRSEGELGAWLASLDSLPSLQSSVEQVHGDAAQHRAARADWLPVVVATGREVFTNASGFGKSPAWAAGVTASWNLGFGKPAIVRERAAALAASMAASHRQRLAARDAIEESFDSVETTRARAIAAGAEVLAATRAAEAVHARYQAGTATHLELRQAERDAFAAQIARVRALADLAYARFALRLAAGRTERVSR